jgi:hypothetical protein
MTTVTPSVIPEDARSLAASIVQARQMRSVAKAITRRSGCRLTKAVVRRAGVTGRPAVSAMTRSTIAFSL